MINLQKQLQLKHKLASLAKTNQLNEAKVIALKLAKALPQDIEVWWALAQLQARTGEYEKAVDSFHKASLKPSPFKKMALQRALDICYGHNYGHPGLQMVKELARLGPLSADNHYKKGRLYVGLFHFCAAIKCFEQAMALDPENSKYRIHYGRSATYVGKFDLAEREFAQSFSDDPDDKMAYFLDIVNGNYDPNVSNETLFNKHIHYGGLLEAKYQDYPALPQRENTPGKIRLGFLSPDFYGHSVSFFISPILKYLDRSKFEVFCYSDVIKEDATTAKIRKLADHWVACTSMNDDQVCEYIRQDEIDILVDLVGYMGAGRLGVFARRAAPIQVSYLGYPNTSGLRQMDYRLSDEWSDPKGEAEPFYTETLYRLPKGFLSYQPTDSAPAVSKLPALHQHKPVTFCSLNIFQKITDVNYRMWSQILKQLPESRLIIKSKQLGEKALHDDLLGKFRAYGVDTDQIEILAWTPRQSDHLKLLEQVDICLDSYPYAGTTTTCEALWQGLPTVTLAGNNHRSRVGVSILNQVGLENWVATREQEYVSIAIAKANALEELSQIRSGLRDRMKQSALVDHALFCRQLEDAFAAMASYKKA